MIMGKKDHSLERIEKKKGRKDCLMIFPLPKMEFIMRNDIQKETEKRQNGKKTEQKQNKEATNANH